MLIKFADDLTAIRATGPSGQANQLPPRPAIPDLRQRDASLRGRVLVTRRTFVQQRQQIIYGFFSGELAERHHRRPL